VIEPLAHAAAALELGTKDLFATAEDFVAEAGKGGRPLVIEVTDSPFGFRPLVRASRIEGRHPDGDAYVLSASEARSGAGSRSSSRAAWATTICAPSILSRWAV
jgi:L-iditol 2-dehydrogenase